jgi:signal transduction histidine kinase
MLPDYARGQVLTNLVSNAIKYSPEGGEIRLTACVEGSSLTIAVRDEGLGLPPEALPRLFQKFSRVEHHRQRGIEGTGLGLAICHQIVTELGGRIWAESAGEGRGSTFTFTVPLDSRTAAS